METPYLIISGTLSSSVYATPRNCAQIARRKTKYCAPYIREPLVPTHALHGFMLCLAWKVGLFCKVSTHSLENITV